MRGGPGLILAAAVLWGTTGTAQALAPDGAAPMVIGAVRLLIGGTALLALALARGALAVARPWPVLPTLLAAAGVAAYQLLFFAGVAATGVAVGTVVAIGSSPVLAGLFALITRGERPAPRWYPATALSVAGCTLLTLAGSAVDVDPTGVILALGAGTAYATYAVASKGLLENRAPDAVTAVVFTVAALLLSPLLAGADLDWLAEPRGAAVALHLGLGTTAAAYALFARGLRSVPVSTAVTLTLAEPLTAAALGILLLAERPSPAALTGMALLIGGLIVLAAGGRGVRRSGGKPGTEAA